MTSGARWELHDARAETPDAWRRRVALEERARQAAELKARFQQLPKPVQLALGILVALRASGFVR